MDHNAKVESRIYWQYKNAPKLIALLLTLPTIAQAQIEEQIAKIKAILDIDNAEGEQLDICGRIAGYSKRPVGTFYPTCSSSAVSDELFRRMIKSKIYKNNSIATIDDVATAMNYILDTEARILDGQDMTMRPVFFEYLDIGSQKLVADYDLIPRPQGVKLRSARFLTYKPFGFGPHYANFRAPFWHGDGIQFYTNLKLTLTIANGMLSGALTASAGVVVSDVDITLIYTLSDDSTVTERLVTDAGGQFSTMLNVGDDFTVVARAQVLTPLCEWENVESGEVITNIFFNGAVTYNGLYTYRG
ncbi:DUF2612 domain-containing protein [Brenneria goodwinii]|uniref:Phage-related protein n=1 Tax=Brenneria goodwinii TaxID=1109412 RepID=A0A0G4K143_9GAMM|nr:DUF2612 domain-containing protein [Brenneria goodwinii]MCG8155203.1 DUF2612 domain-containing protein [Brenneria goodwinii]MCG8159447.1 DUF2612 domain-containing protein [Brenneria goodwinii]MCG8164384.1 DUF2612 domain-containing protein [Brenneria goodwinii]MCG8169050.1 DUF2612 domain-containing protein [Brenneria goodwinii]MCG8173306.1 DUF2612 domain-containing protein [Brenneria goodwinii]